jgi:hypothetical protein
MTTALTKSTPPGSYAAATSALTMAAGDVAGNTFVASGNDLVIIHNTDAAPHNVVFTSVADPRGRTGDITESILAGAYRQYGPMKQTGWMNPGGTITITPADTTVKVGVITLP